jgi:hypothetical protein
MLDDPNSRDGESGQDGRRFGRRLADFHSDGLGTPHGLYESEAELLEAALTGQKCVFSDGRPEAPTDGNRVRPGFLRFLALGGDENAPVHEKGVHLSGAFIEGALDLDYADSVKPLALTRCWIDGGISARNAQFVDLTLDGSRCEGAVFDDAKFAGNVLIQNDFLSQGGLRFTGAEIAGDFYMSGAVLTNPAGDALACRRLKVYRGVFLTDGFVANGKVRFSGAEIGGDFHAYGGSFIQPNAAKLIDPNDYPYMDDALTLANATIKGILWLAPWVPPYDQQVDIRGSLNLQGAQVTTLLDHELSWPLRTAETPHGNLPCLIQLDGFVYERLGGPAPIDAGKRKKWLLQQTARGKHGVFRPQPFEQLIKVLRSMGHDHEARRIGLLKESLIHPLNIHATSAWSRPFALLTDHLYGFFTGYGYRPHRLAVTILLMWISSAWFFSIAERQGAFAPREAEIWTNERLMTACGTERWTACSDVFDLIPFNAASYAADTIIPIIDLQQRSSWTPMLKKIEITIPYFGQKTLPSGTLLVVTWCVNIFGALAVILLGAIASGLVKKD